MDFAATPLLGAAALAFVGGLLSFLSPCVLPLVPAYLGHLAGTSLRGATRPPRWLLASHAVAFVVGFGLIFTLGGVALGLVSQSFRPELAGVGALSGLALAGLDALRIIGGLVVIVMGLHTAGLITIPLLYRQAKMDSSQIKGGSLVSSFLIGVFFAAGWSPCVGTILTAIFALAASHTAQAGLLFFSYSLGLGLPFIVASLLLGRFTGWMRHLNRHQRVLGLVSGAFLVLVGVLLVTNSFAWLAALLPPIEPFEL